MKVLIVHAHAEPKSFNGALTERAVATLTAEGHEVQVSDLYAMGFNPVSDRSNFTTIANPDYLKQQAEEAYATEHDGFAPEILAEIEKLEWCDTLIFQFPLWWFGLPAILKGWVDRIFAYKRVYAGGFWYDKGAFTGKRALLSLTTGGVETAYSPSGLQGSIDQILYPIQHGMLAFTGFDVLPPFVSWSVAHIDDASRAGLLDAWDARLRALTTTKPIVWTPALSDLDKTFRDTVPSFVVHGVFTGEPPAELVAAERIAVASLKAHGVLKSIQLASDYRQGWLLLRAADEETVWGHLRALPLFEYLRWEVVRVG
ncbi:hypothetical protein CCAX7_004020 [Capsulimonas corticalis]|uniref:Uncharacterized protein n=1 Tax=Capsulimonas corticalis TaxID=2219043 RepID=A0A402D380_9BACT|nr:NAD(P)H-dependent oxidoreductase [Capsulimonas corticalis]BDI28351.1 hypothetical protein CCAX7_004020 [Capsulimonas corticalis]